MKFSDIYSWQGRIASFNSGETAAIASFISVSETFDYQ
jgi:hypothetical protein